ncbi:glycosyltransferase family 2 protein [Fulvivirgaceae bacterium BMA10]|uniref:Glycosyltransferase family 2 protein n=1 Tax=Splendidivirga corallicola TaxID=3051826 RepID=A0ABT8KMS9_9BACT|nr:glycosyltransferase family 2 protein [Fulvivirgaceae bacterium BMA10]
MAKSKDISVVIPLYNEEESITELCKWISRVMESHGFHYEIVIVDDGSTDNSWEIINNISSENGSVKAVKFKRNYGKSAALNTAFRCSEGDVVITMDADLQDSPDEIPELFKMIKEDGYELVSGWKKKRYDPLSKTIPSKFFNYITRKITGIKLHDFNCGLKAYTSELVKSIEVYGEMHRYIPAIAKWNGFNRIGERVVQHSARKYGQTKFGLERYIYGFLDLLSITFVSKFKKRPMHFFGTMGTLSFIFGFIVATYLIGEKVYINLFLNERARGVVEQPLFFLALTALIIGVQLFLAGFLAEMISINSNKKGDYLIEKKIGL